MERLTKRNNDGSVGISECRYYNYQDFQKLCKRLAEYEDLEEQCIRENQCSLRMLVSKWKEFFEGITELYEYRELEKQGLLKRIDKNS